MEGKELTVSVRMVSYKHKYPRVFSTLSRDQEIQFREGKVWVTSHNVADEHNASSSTVKNNQTYQHSSSALPKQGSSNTASNYQYSDFDSEDSYPQRNTQAAPIAAKKLKVGDKLLEIPKKQKKVKKPKEAPKTENVPYSTRYGRKVRLPSRYIQ